MRKSFIQLPTLAELEETLKTEACRSISPEKVEVHFASLEPFIEFLKKIKIDTRKITLDKTWQEVRLISEKLINEAIPAILSSEEREINLAARKLYQYLAEEDKPKRSDLIMTFGAKTMARVKKAIWLYHQGFAPKLLFSGGNPLYERQKALPEAEVYKKIALASGVKVGDIIPETGSITLADNIRSSLNRLDKLNIRYKSIILVNSPYSQRRGYSHMEKFTPVGTKIYRVNCPARKGLRENDWFTNEEGIKYVLTEYYKLWFGLVINTN